MLDTTQLEGQQDLLLQRFGENTELVSDVRAGMRDNLTLAKQNIEFLKKGGVPASNVAAEEKAAPAGSGGPPS